MDRIIRAAEVAKALSCSKPHLYSLIRRGQFPAGVMIGIRSRGWRESEVSEWLASLKAAPAPRPISRPGKNAPASAA
jgi:prophage regulatory protein